METEILLKVSVLAMDYIEFLLLILFDQYWFRVTVMLMQYQFILCHYYAPLKKKGFIVLQMFVGRLVGRPLTFGFLEDT